jgi:hypothetical protein
VTIPFGWNLVIDESPPPLYMLVIEVRFCTGGPALLPTTQHAVNFTASQPITPDHLQHSTAKEQSTLRCKHTRHAQHAFVFLLRLTRLQGNVWFSNTTNITLAANFIIVQRTGVLSAGSAAVPHPTPVNILLAGTRQTPQLAISNDLVLGSKVGSDPWVSGQTMVLFNM